MKYYLDTCIWLNLFKKEGDPTKGMPYWKIAEEFMKKIMFSENEIIYSGFILREFEFCINNISLFMEWKKFIKKDEKMIFAIAKNEDYNFARKFELKTNFEISFYDCLHIAICKRMDCVFVTRDKDLIKVARKYINIDKPENLIV